MKKDTVMSSFLSSVCGRHHLLCIPDWRVPWPWTAMYGNGKKAQEMSTLSSQRGGLQDESLTIPSQPQQSINGHTHPLPQGIMAGRELSGATVSACFTVTKAELSSLAHRVGGGPERGMSWRKGFFKAVHDSEATPWLWTWQEPTQPEVWELNYSDKLCWDSRSALVWHTSRVTRENCKVSIINIWATVCKVDRTYVHDLNRMPTC